jgi:predicted DsbA family dithiol-disulfide isomerase
VVDIKWQPFFLNPNMPKEGANLVEYLSKKYGEQVVKSFSAPGNPLDRAGAAVGITFNKTRRVINTSDGHRLMEYCYRTTPEKGDALMEQLFLAYFVHGKDLSKHSELVCAAGAVEGINVEEVSSMLLSPISHAEQAVMNEYEQQKNSMRVNGVPYFVIQSEALTRPIVFSGAQPAEIIAESLEEAKG